MDMSFEEKVRERAYQIWMSAGMADGRAHEHWLTAEAAVRDEGTAPAVKVTKRAVVKPATVAPRQAAAKKAPAKTSIAEKATAKH